MDPNNTTGTETAQDTKTQADGANTATTQAEDSGDGSLRQADTSRETSETEEKPVPEPESPVSGR